MFTHERENMWSVISTVVLKLKDFSWLQAVTCMCKWYCGRRQI